MNQGNDKQVCKSNICDALHDLVSVPVLAFRWSFERTQMHANAFSYLHAVSVCMSWHGIQTGLLNVKRLNTIQTGKH